MAAVGPVTGLLPLGGLFANAKSSKADPASAVSGASSKGMTILLACGGELSGLGSMSAIGTLRSAASALKDRHTQSSRDLRNDFMISFYRISKRKVA